MKESSKIKIDDKGTIKYRIWEKSKKLMTYIFINFPEEYNDNIIFLKDIVSEKEVKNPYRFLGLRKGGK